MVRDSKAEGISVDSRVDSKAEGISADSMVYSKSGGEKCIIIRTTL